MEFVVSMGAYLVTNREEGVIRTFALASCVAVTAYSPIRRAAGMIHVVLPSPFGIRDRLERPAYFAESGIPLMIDTLCMRYGCRKEELVIQMYGGAESTLQQDVFSVGEKNIDAARRALAAMGLAVRRAELRGNESRTISLEVRTGSVEVIRQPIGK